MSDPIHEIKRIFAPEGPLAAAVAGFRRRQHRAAQGPRQLRLSLSPGTRDERRPASREEAAHLRKIARFAERTKTGDKAECSDVPEDSAAWALATSTRENCLGQECPHVKSAALSWRRDKPC